MLKGQIEMFNLKQNTISTSQQTLVLHAKTFERKMILMEVLIATIWYIPFRYQGFDVV